MPSDYLTPLMDETAEMFYKPTVAGDLPRNPIEVIRAQAQLATSRPERFAAEADVRHLEKLGGDARQTPEDIVRKAKGFTALEDGLDAECDALADDHGAKLAELERRKAAPAEWDDARDAVVVKALAIWGRTLDACVQLEGDLKPRTELTGNDAAAALVFFEMLAHATPKSVIARAHSIAATGSDALWAVVRAALVRLRKSPPGWWKGMSAVLDGVLSLRGDPEGLAMDAYNLGRDFAERSRKQIRTKLGRVVAK